MLDKIPPMGQSKAKTTGKIRLCPYCGEAMEDRSFELNGRYCQYFACTCPQYVRETRRREEAEFRQELRAIEARNRAEHIQRLKEKSGLGKRFLSRTFDNYQVNTTAQKTAHATAKAYAANFAANLDQGRGLYLAGNFGTGKTHLAAAIALNLLDQGYEVWFRTGAALLQELRQRTVQEGESEGRVVKGYGRVKLLILDDLGKEKATEWSVAVLGDIINQRYENALPLVITSNYTLKTLAPALTPPGNDGSVARSIISRLTEMTQGVTMAWDDRRQHGQP